MHISTVLCEEAGCDESFEKPEHFKELCTAIFGQNPEIHSERGAVAVLNCAKRFSGIDPFKVPLSTNSGARWQTKSMYHHWVTV